MLASIARSLADPVALLRIRPQERAPLLWLMLYATAAIGGVLTVGYSVATALFLSQVPTTATALVFAVTGAAVMITILGYNRLSARVRIAPLVVATSLILALLALVFRGLLATPVGDRLWFLLLLNLFAEIAFTLAIMQLWSCAGQVFDPRQARRLFGVLAVGGTAANMVFGLLLSAVVGRIGTENLLYAVAASLLICGLCARALRPWLAGAEPMNARGPGPSLVDDLRSIGATPLLRSIAVLTVLLSLLLNIATYQFYLVLQQDFRGSDVAMTVYLGRFEFAAGMAALLLHLFIGRRLIRDRGIFLAMLVLPAAVALGSGWMLATGGSLLAASLLFAADPVLRRTLGDASMNALFLPLPVGMRSRSKELMEMIYALTFSVAGLIFLLLQRLPGWNVVHWSYPLFALALAWWLLSPGVRRNYLQALSDSLRFRRLDASAGAVELHDEASVAVLRRALEDPDDLRVLHALKLIAKATDRRWSERVRPLLRHASPLVRREVVGLLRTRNKLDAGEATELLDDPDDEVRAAAGEALLALQGHEALPQLAPLLDEAPLGLRSALLSGALRWSGAPGRAVAAPRLAAMAASADPAERAGAAKIVGRLGADEGIAALTRLLRDPDPAVRRAAARSAAAVGSVELVPPLLDALGHPVTAPEAAEALTAFGERIAPTLQRVFASGRSPRAARIRMLELLVAAGSAEMEAFLLARLDERDPDVRGAVYRLLATVRTGAPSRDALLAARLEIEMGEAYRWARTPIDLGASSCSPLLAEALARRTEREKRRLLWLCAALYPSLEPVVARVALDPAAAVGDPRLIELLDAELSPELRGSLLPLFEGTNEQIAAIAAERLGLPRCRDEQRLSELAAEEDDWLAACALFEIGRRGYAELDAGVFAALEARSPLVRQTALACMRQLHGDLRAGVDDGRVRRAARAQLADPDPSVRQFARVLLSGRGAS